MAFKEYWKRYDGLVERYESAKQKCWELDYDIRQKEAQSEKIRQFIKALKKQEGVINEFDRNLWGCLVDHVTIGREKRSITFRDGTEITV